MMELLGKLATLWLPVFAAVGFFWLWMRGANRNGKTMMDEQAIIQRDIAHHLDRIATALEKRP
jgi:hypothetical protein